MSKPVDFAAIRRDIDAALLSVAMKHGLKSLRAGNASYMSENFTIKLDGVVMGGLNKEQSQYERHAKYFGLPPLATGFTAGGVRYETYGMNTTGSKVIVKRVSDGKLFNYATDVVARICSVPA